jgi:hypothetical protein
MYNFRSFLLFYLTLFCYLQCYEKAVKEDEKTGDALEKAIMTRKEARLVLQEIIEDLDVEKGHRSKKAINAEAKASKAVEKATLASDRSTTALQEARKDLHLKHKQIRSTTKAFEQTKAENVTAQVQRQSSGNYRARLEACVSQICDSNTQNVNNVT